MSLPRAAALCALLLLPSAAAAEDGPPPTLARCAEADLVSRTILPIMMKANVLRLRVLGAQTALESLGYPKPPVFLARQYVELDAGFRDWALGVRGAALTAAGFGQAGETTPRQARAIAEKLADRLDADIETLRICTARMEEIPEVATPEKREEALAKIAPKR